MKAIGKAIVIVPEKDTAKKTKGGLLLNAKDREDIRYIDATVFSVGELIPKEVLKEGDNIKYDRHAGHGLEHNKQSYKVIKIEDVVVVL
jgi:co-chaperonin GroES (HSP10)